MREKVAMYNFTVQWTPGKTHLIADALSRAPLFAAKDLPALEIDTAITCLSMYDLIGITGRHIFSYR